MTGERVGGVRLDESERAIAGKTIAAARLEHWCVGLRFTDGTWAYGGSFAYEDDLSSDWAADVPNHVLLDLGVIEVDEYEARERDRVAADQAKLRERRQALYESLRAEFEGEAPR